MPDITMCKGNDCPHKEKCYRFMATPDIYQTYFMEPPNKENKCDYYWGENAKSIWVESNDEIKSKQ
jgi:hypothetical protein